MKTCGSCGNKAGRSAVDARKVLSCQSCSCNLCENCAVYGYDLMPRCEDCHDDVRQNCEDNCKGNKKLYNCDNCDLPKIDVQKSK